MLPVMLGATNMINFPAFNMRTHWSDFESAVDEELKEIPKKVSVFRVQCLASSSAST